MQNTEIKERGLAFGRALQVVLKQCAIYSSAHPSIKKPMENTYSLLSEVLKSAGQFAFGFAGERVLVNNLVAVDPSLRSLQQEFQQRNIAGIVVLPTITVTEFQRLVALLATTNKVLAEKGGAQQYFQDNPVTGARIVLSPEHSEALLINASSERLLAGTDWATSFSEVSSSGTSSSPGTIDQLMETIFSEQAGNSSQGRVEAMVHSALSSHSGLSGLLENVTSLIQESEGASGPGGKGTGEKAQEMLEDVAARWAINCFSSIKSPSDIPNVFEGVVERLKRALVNAAILQNTLQKISRLSEEQKLDTSVLDLLRRELSFYALSLEEQKADLLKRKRYTTAEFRQLINTIKALLGRNEFNAASELAKNFVAVLEEKDVTNEELSRTADLFHVMRACQQTDFFAVLRKLVVNALPKLTEPERHQRLVRLIGIEGTRALEQKDWDALHAVVTALETQLIAGTEHDLCCRAETDRLEKQAGLDEILEAIAAPRESQSSTRQSISLCKVFGARTAEKLLQRLEVEKDAAVRLRLVRAVGQSGEGAIKVVRGRLTDSRWYVVRNACSLLGELDDPELLTQLTPALTHNDERVQMAAVQTLLRKRISGREEVLATNLVKIHPHVAEIVLDDLLIMRDSKCLRGVQSFLESAGEGKSGLLMKAVQVAAVIKSNESRQLLATVASNESLPVSVRQSAKVAAERT